MVEYKDNTNGWAEWSKYVLKELERLNGCYEDMGKDIKKISIDIAMLQVKSSLWGVAGGMVPVIIMILVSIFSGK